MKALTIIFLISANLLTNNLKSQTACEIWGEISMEAVTRGTLYTCYNSANLVVCEIALASKICSENPSCEGVFKEINVKGCNVVLEAVQKSIKISVKAKKESYDIMLEAYLELHNNISNLYWKNL